MRQKMARPIEAVPDQYFCKYCQQPQQPEEMEMTSRGRRSKSCCKKCRYKRSAQWKRDRPNILLAQHARQRAKVNGWVFDLKNEDIVVPEFCPVLGIKLSMGDGKLHDFSATLDRIKPDLGYVRGNIAVISYRANRIKSNGTAEEVRKVADWMDAQTKEAANAELAA
jgi:hypothetical protein